MSNFDLKDYIEVKDRVSLFWEKYPNGRIESEIVRWEEPTIAMKSCVYKSVEDTNPAATGHAYEKIGEGFVNKGSALENCETSAVGRALAILGFEISKSIASRNEMENIPATKEQIKKMEEMIKKSEADKTKFTQWACKELGIKSINDLKAGHMETIYKALEAKIEKVEAEKLEEHFKQEVKV